MLAWFVRGATPSTPAYMSFAIIRTNKIKTVQQMDGMNSHNTRSVETPNADPELKGYNTRPIGSNNLRADIESRIEQSGVKTRKDSVKAIEYLITASPEAFGYKKHEDGILRGDVEKWKEFEKRALDFLRERHGAENVVNFTVHKDEKTPHIHAYCVPLIQKEVKQKNRHMATATVSKQLRLSAKDYLGGKEKLRQLQSDFHSKVADLGLERGRKGSRARHDSVQKFYERVNEDEKRQERIPEISIETPKARFEMEKPSLLTALFNREKWIEEQKSRANDLLTHTGEDIASQARQGVSEMVSSVRSTLTGYEHKKGTADALSAENKRLMGNVKRMGEKIEELEHKLLKTENKVRQLDFRLYKIGLGDEGQIQVNRDLAIDRKQKKEAEKGKKEAPKKQAQKVLKPKKGKGNNPQIPFG